MADAEFSLKERDKIRYLKDRLVAFIVRSGGIGVLAAILLIFFYLISMVLPIFSRAEVNLQQSYRYEQQNPAVGMGVGDYGENAFIFDDKGNLIYVGFEQGKANELLTTSIIKQPSVFAKSPQSQRWYAYANNNGEVIAIQPDFTVSFSAEGRVLTPDLKVYKDDSLILLNQQHQSIKQLVFAIEQDTGTFVGVTESGEIDAVRVLKNANATKQADIWSVKSLSVPDFPAPIDQLKISPNGEQLFVLSGNGLMIAQLKGDQYQVREFVDLSYGDVNKSVKQIEVLSGAHSILVMHQDNSVSQWFDVLKSGERIFTKIREFKLKEPSQFVLTDTYRKGFYSFSENGNMESFYSTSENELFSGKIYSELPSIVSLSNNESYLIALDTHQITVHNLINNHPEVTFSSIWRTVWYESYPEPQYVWQSTSASDDFEAKFSLVPIAFGTLKATFYAMLFSVPLAILGAIYTAYFMPSSMRKVVKPSIEIMEALPTVILGFLAGLWLAPIVETYLTGVMALIILLPASMLIVSFLWALLPKAVIRTLPNGWHVLILVPVIVIVSYLSIHYSVDLERSLFDGDVRLFLAEHGISYDQRNALVVGLAMGFAVIPTIFTIAEDAIFSVPQHLSDGSLALGATRWQTLLYVVLLTASPGIFSAVMIGLGRAVGETMIVLMATGNTPIMDFSIFEGMRSLSATIAVEMPETEVGDTHYRVLFLAALLLFIFTFIVNSLAEIVRQRLKDRYSSM
ncbi:ABC transporter permease subunit [Vibrio sp. TH_r3]|uniref:ABC transporter permease subunit n=1 Tax=Vibrio sp. TH_r3 TaxID=3082084 RepID=UPI0029552AF4|nr:ABC transporter permease subunit [Vibrio sp. TH_r3]MDV7105335.1 ABC transporter permease subunit [Vibrio sp. TH_r3]